MTINKFCFFISKRDLKLAQILKYCIFEIVKQDKCPKKKVQILEFGICWPLSVELISENVGNRGNPSTYYLKLSVVGDI
jgi:hypothetical protein